MPKTSKINKQTKKKKVCHSENLSMKCMKLCFQHQEAESKQTLDGCEMERVPEELLFLPGPAEENS